MKCDRIFFFLKLMHRINKFLIDSIKLNYYKTRKTNYENCLINCKNECAYCLQIKYVSGCFFFGNFALIKKKLKHLYANCCTNRNL